MADRKPRLDPKTLRHVARRLRRLAGMFRQHRRDTDDLMDREYWSGAAEQFSACASEFSVVASGIERRAQR